MEIIPDPTTHTTTRVTKGRPIPRSFDYVTRRQKENEHFYKLNNNQVFTTKRQPTDNEMQKYFNELKTYIQAHRDSQQRKLTISFFNCSAFTDETLNSLGIWLSKNAVNLRSLSVIFLWSFPRITDQGLRGFCLKICKHLSHIQELHLSLNLYGCNQITNKGLVKIVSDITKNLVSLRKLELDFFNFHNLSDQTLKAIGLKIRNNLPELTHLKVRLRKSDILFQDKTITENVPVKLVKNQRGFSNLQSLLLNIEHCGELTPNIFTVLKTSSLSSLSNLRNLHLNLSGDYAQADHIKALGIAIGTHLTNLQWLSIKISGEMSNQQITDETIQSLGLNICRNLKHLEKLSFNFPYHMDITDQALSTLATEIASHQQKLNEVLLAFSNCPFITQAQKESARSILKFIPRLSVY